MWRTWDNTRTSNLLQAIKEYFGLCFLWKLDQLLRFCNVKDLCNYLIFPETNSELLFEIYDNIGKIKG
jgi:hypothetical protein